MDAYNKAGQQVVWDATSITAATTCPRKYYYQILRSWRSRHTNIHLTFGKIFATALEDFFNAASHEHFYYDQFLAFYVERIIKETYTEPAFEGERSKTRLALIRALVYYLDTYFDHDHHRIFEADGERGIELTFAIEVSPNWVLTGRMDRVIKGDNGLQILDQKTAGGPLNTAYFANYTPNNQVSAYQLAGKIAFPERAKALLIDAVSVAGGKIALARDSIVRSTGQLEEWVKNTQTLINYMHQHDPTDPTAFPQNPSACAMFGGCAFRGICSAAPEVREIILEEEFVQAPWNPVKGVSVLGD